MTYGGRLGSTKGLLAVKRKSLEYDIVSMAFTRPWQNLLEYGRRFCCAAIPDRLISWESKVTEGKTRVRWKCVSSLISIPPSHIAKDFPAPAFSTNRDGGIGKLANQVFQLKFVA
jgi:hypothetical protein